MRSSTALIGLALRPGSSLAYLELFRFRYHLSFVGVLLGALLVARGETPALTGDILLLYVSFNVLFYGGLYTINALADAPDDRLHPQKRHRPVASGAISPAMAVLFAVLLLSGGIVTAVAWFGPMLLPAFALVGLLNVAYSGGLRNVPLADILLNSATHPPRLWMGVSLAGGACRWEWLTLVFLFAVAMSALRRSIELRDVGPASRPVLSRYTPARLLGIRVAAFVAVLAMWIAQRPAFWLPYAVTAIAFAIVVFAGEGAPRSRAAFSRFWGS